MKTEDVLNILSFDFKGFRYHQEFFEEITQLLKDELSGKEKEFFDCLYTQLNYIKNFGQAIYNVDDHEKLLGFDGQFFSIHIKRKQFNIRLLVHIDKSGDSIFLCAFYERSGHKASSYKKYTRVMEERYQDMIKGKSDD